LSRGALEWLQALRERAERRAEQELRARRARLLEAGRSLRDARAGVPAGQVAGVAELAQAARLAGWAEGGVVRRARQEAEGRAQARESRSAAEALRVLLGRRREAERAARYRRQEAAAGDDLLARGRGSGSGR